MNIYESVTEIVSWYKDLPKDYSNINDLIYARQKLSTYQFYMAVDLGDLREDWKQKEVETEIVRRKKSVECIMDSLAMTKVQEISKHEALEKYQIEKEADANYHKVKFIIESTQEVNNTIMQHISQLKLEQKNLQSQT